MNHTHLYGFLNNTCYRVPIYNSSDEIIAISGMNSCSRVSTLPSAKVFAMKININTAEYVENPVANHTFCSQLVEWVKDQKISSIMDLRDTYKIEIDYTIATMENQLVDEGVMVQTIAPKEVLVVQPISETNELYYRKALKFDKIVKFTRSFPASYNIMNQITPKYKFKIHAIRIKGITDCGVDDPKEEYLTNTVVDLTGRRRAAITTSTVDGVVLFDTAKIGLKFVPEIVPFKPREIGVDFTLVLNEFCEFGSEVELLNALKDNSGETSSEDPGDIGGGHCHPNIHPHPGFQPQNPVRPLDPPNKDENPDEPGNPDTPTDPDKPTDEDSDLRWEYQRVDSTTSDDEQKYTVVADDTDPFDPETMAKISDVQKHISDIQLGEQVYWGWTWNI